MHEYYVAKHTIYQVKKELGEVHPSLVKKVGLEIGKCQVSYQRLWRCILA